MNSKLYFRRLEELAVFGLWRDCKNIYISSGFLLRFGILSNANFWPKIRLICQLKTNLKIKAKLNFPDLKPSPSKCHTCEFLLRPTLHLYFCLPHFYHFWWQATIPIEETSATVTWHSYIYIDCVILLTLAFLSRPTQSLDSSLSDADNCQELPPAMTPFSCRDSRQPGFVFESHLHRIVRRWQQNLSRPPFDSVANDFLWPVLKFDDLFNMFLDQQMINIDEQWSTNDEQYQFQKWWEMDRLWCARKQYSKRWVDKNLWSKWSRKTIPETMRDFDVWSVAAEVMFPRKEVNLKTLAPDWKLFLISLFPKKEFNFQALSAD